MKTLNDLSAKSAADFLEGRLDQAPCDHDAVSVCVRCNALYLARYTRFALAQRGSEGAWISVEDRLPEDGDVVMVCDIKNQSTGILGAWRLIEGVETRWTHWRPLLELPAAPAGGEADV